MGYRNAEDAATVMSEMMGLDAALEYHLTANHYPPVPTEMIPIAKRAIELGVLALDDATFIDEPIELPEGVTTGKGETSTPAHEVIRGLHLEPFVKAAAYPEEEGLYA